MYYNVVIIRVCCTWRGSAYLVHNLRQNYSGLLHFFIILNIPLQFLLLSRVNHTFYKFKTTPHLLLYSKLNTTLFIIFVTTHHFLLYWQLHQSSVVGRPKLLVGVAIEVMVVEVSFLNANEENHSN